MFSDSPELLDSVKSKPLTSHITGHIERVIFYNEESSFCVLAVRIPEKSEWVTVTGKAAQVMEGESIDCTGSWANHPTYGNQFKADILKLTPPNNAKDIENYLASGSVQGVGPHLAKIMVDAFGDKTLDVIDYEPQRLAALNGIGEKRLKSILKAWSEQGDVRKSMIILQSYGLGSARAARVYQVYGENTLSAIKENPYRLALEVEGIGFKTADSIAKKLKIPHDSPFRAQAGIRYVLKQICDQGHCSASIQELLDKTSDLLEVNTTVLRAAIDHQIHEKQLIPDSIDGESVVFLKQFFYSEVQVARSLIDLMTGPLPWDGFDIKHSLSWVESEANIKFSKSQKQAMTVLLKNKVVIVTGGPGVGKTTIINSLLKLLHQKSMRVMLCAPTGRAAKRMSETTGCISKTIHRLLEFSPKTFKFKYNSDNLLPLDVLIVDEASMLDMLLMNSLLKAIPKHAALILVGDVDQLPSVGSGQILSDLIESKVLKTVRLTETFRQANNSKIIVNAHRINQGKMPLKHDINSDFYVLYFESSDQIKDILCDLVHRRIPNYLNIDSMQDIQVLTPVNRGDLGAVALNVELKKQLNGHSSPQIQKAGVTFSPGDKVIQTVNNYDKEVFNGDIGFISHISTESRELSVLFDNRLIAYDFNSLSELNLAYAVSIHKSQGSEYPVVVMPLSMQHFILLKRNLVYTGVTRGKRLVVLLAEKKALAMAVRETNGQRLTKLKQRLLEFKKEL